MDDLPTSEPSSADVPSQQRNCAYCGAPLVGAYYFCIVCATPYKDAESVLSRPKPAQLSDGTLIAEKAPQVWRLFWSYVASVTVVGVLGLAFGGADKGTWMVLAEAVLFVVTCVFAFQNWQALAVQFKRIGLLHPAALLGLLALAPLLGVNYVYHGWLVRQFGAGHEGPFRSLRAFGMGEAALVFFFCVCPAVIEEISFRGLVQHWLQVAIPPLHALVLASVLFTVLHGSVVSAPYLFAVGMLLGWVKWKTGSLYPSMLIHFLHNWVVVEFF